MHQAIRFEVRVRVQGELAPGWSAVLGDLTVIPEPDGTTLVTGELPDQAAVHGVLASGAAFGRPGTAGRHSRPSTGSATQAGEAPAR